MKMVTALFVFLAGFVALVAAAFMFANSENSKATDALQKAEVAEKHADLADASVKSVEEKLAEIDSNITALANSISENREETKKSLEAQSKRLEWVEMRVEANKNVRGPSSISERVILSQEKPLQVSIIYKKAAEAKPTAPESAESQTIKRETNEAQRKAIINKVKKQVKELSQ